MPQQKKKLPEPSRKSNPYLGWIALLAVVAAVAVFLFTRQGEEAPPAVPSQASVAQQPQSAPAQPAPTQTTSASPAAQTETAPAKSAPQTAVTTKREHHEAAPAPLAAPLPAPVTPPSPVSAQQPPPQYRMPAYFEDPDAAEPLAPTLDPDTVPTHAREAYEVAKRKPKLLAQLPCFCYCDRFGHKSLHDCYAGTHAVECDVCLREALEADQMDNQGMTPQEIRAAIIASHHPRTQ